MPRQRLAVLATVLLGVVASPRLATASVAQAEPAAAITEYPLPTAHANPAGIVAGPDGNLWFTEPGANQIGKITASGVVTEYPVPTPDSDPLQVVAGPDGRLWFTELRGGKLGAIGPEGNIAEYPLPPLRRPQGITAGPDGNVWFTELSASTAETWIGKMTTSGDVTEYPIGSYNNPVGITAGADGNIWSTLIGSNGSDAILRITPAGVVTPFPLQLPGSTAHPVPQGIAPGPDGNVWFAERNPAQIGVISPQGVVTQHTVPTSGSSPTGITTKRNGSVWFTELDGNRIGRLGAAGGMVEIAIPTPDSAPSGITIGLDGHVWFTESNGNKIGKAEPLIRTALAYTGDTLMGPRRPAHLAAVLTHGESPISGRDVTFTIGGAPACTSTTDATGVAACQTSPVDRLGGNQPVVASFVGDAGYGPATADASVFVVTYASLCDLSQQLVTNPSLASSLCDALRMAERNQRLGLLPGQTAGLSVYRQLVSVARTTGSLTPEQATLLISASDLL